jgi:hypothetical protein
MKNSTQIAILAAVGVGAYLILKSSPQAVNTLRPVSSTYPYGMQSVPAMGTPAYAQWQAQQAQANLDAQKLGVLYGVGKMVNGIFGGGSSGPASNPYSGITEIYNNDLPGQAGYGWKYFSDGTTIGPDGSYYKDSQVIWTPTDSVPVNPPFNTSYYDSLQQDF